MNARRGRPVRVVYNPLDTVRFDPTTSHVKRLEKELGFSANEMLLGVFAQYAPWKGHELAVRALARLQINTRISKLLISGSQTFTSRSTRYDNLEPSRRPSA